VIRVSAGTAAALGLLDWKTEEFPTTAYLLWMGDQSSRGCLMNCAFCAQGRENSRDGDRLSRVIWPAYEEETLVKGLGRAKKAGLKRICLQGVRSEEGAASLAELIRRIQGVVSLPVSVSAWVGDCGEVDHLFRAGADRLGIALDVADPQVYARIKGGSLEKRYRFLREAAHRYPGRITTHLICGLGETEEQLLRQAQNILEEGIHVALFAFTPVRGTPLASWPPPELASYRRIQAALQLLRRDPGSWASLRFRGGRLISLGLDRERLREALDEGAAFQTSGCPGCNRPYYNERPGWVPYNYPRPLTSYEKEENLELLWQHLEEEP